MIYWQKITEHSFWFRKFTNDYADQTTNDTCQIRNKTRKNIFLLNIFTKIY